MKAAKHIAVADRQIKQAKAMRASMTEPERRLWRALRTRLPIAGTHFRRQVPIGAYIVDFCCIGAKLVVEVDGNQHGTDRAQAYDAIRTAHLESHGFHVLRFANEDVIRALDSVLDTIFAAVATTLTPNPSPQGGGEESPSHG